MSITAYNASGESSRQGRTVMPTTLSAHTEMAAAHIPAPDPFFDRPEYISRAIADEWLGARMPGLRRADAPPPLQPLARMLLDWAVSYGLKCRAMAVLLREIANYPADAPQREQRLASKVRSADILYQDIYTYRNVIDSMSMALVQGRKQP